MALAFTTLEQNKSDVDAITMTSGSVSVASGSLLLAVMATRHASSLHSMNTVTWNGIGLSSITGATNGNRRTTVYGLQVVTGATATATWNFTSGTNQDHFLWALVEVTGHDTVTPWVAANVVSTTGTALTAQTVTLPNALGSANNAIFGVCGHLVNQGKSAANSETELFDQFSGFAGGGSGLQGQWKLNSLTSQWSWVTSSNTWECGVEINAAVAGGGMLRHPGMGGMSGRLHPGYEGGCGA